MYRDLADLKSLENDPEPDVRSVVQQRLSSFPQADG